MAEWRKIAKLAMLADGHISTREVDILREGIFADGKVSQSELEFLKEIRTEAKSCVQVFTDLYIDAVKGRLLADGKIDDAEAKWLRQTIFADNKVDDAEKQMLEALKAEAKETSPAFDALYNECMK